MTGNAQAWRAEIKADFAKQIGGLKKAVQYIGLQAMNRVTAKSPVDTGRFRGNWLASVGTVNGAVLETVDKTGAATIGRAQTSLGAYAAMEGFPSIFLQNNLPYAVRLEGGYSNQAPGGMVALTVAELSAIWNATKLP